MGQDSKISWTTHTWNPWWGCTKIDGSPACEHCYAETFSRRVGFSDLPTASKFPIWGAQAQRRFFGDKHWNEPLKWNEAAASRYTLEYVFCASMADWAEGRPDQQESLQRLWDLQSRTPWLVWLMLTKRPQLISKLCAAGSDEGASRRWHGVTAETQKWLDIRWPHLKEVFSPVKWLSMEPLFENIRLPQDFLDLGNRAGVIVGGESGRQARPMHPDFARYLRDQCAEAGVPFHFKQWGEWAPGEMVADQKRYPTMNYFDGKWSRCSDDWMTEEDGGPIMYRLGTDKTGHLIDGVEWHQFPRECAAR